LTIGALRSSVGLADAGAIITTDLRAFYANPRRILKNRLSLYSASAMPLLEHNISSNEHLCTSARPHPAVLDWDEAIPKEIENLKAGIDAIVCVVS
jgi:hypothetical protein